MKLNANILWLDGLGGLLVGLLCLILHNWLSNLYGLEPKAVLFLAGANLLYGSYSTSLAFRQKRPKAMIRFLSLANMSWTLVCGVLIFMWMDKLSVFGYASLIGEGLYVGWLGLTEAKILKAGGFD